MKKYIWMLCALLSAQFSAEAAEQFVKFSSPAQHALLLTGTNDTIRYSQNDWAGVKMAVDNLRKDFRSSVSNCTRHMPVASTVFGSSTWAT